MGSIARVNGIIIAASLAAGLLTDGVLYLCDHGGQMPRLPTG